MHTPKRPPPVHPPESSNPTTATAHPSPLAETGDLDCAAWLYAQGIQVLSYRREGYRTLFTFQCAPETVMDYYGAPGETARTLALARRTLLGLVRGGGR
jgi:hypothetical protein